MKDISISIVIPVYNVQKYIVECLESVLKQSFVNFEVILVDDGSTDKSPEICDKYSIKDNRIKVIHKINEGLGRARNVGLAKASGKYVIFLDSDDLWDSSTLSILYSIIERDELDILQFSAEPFADNLYKKRCFDNYHHTKQNDKIDSGANIIFNDLKEKEYFASCCLKLINREYLISNNYKFDEGIMHEDESFSFITLINAKKVENIGKCLYKRRYRSNSITTTSSNRLLSIVGYSKAFNSICINYINNEKSLSKKKKILYIEYLERLLLNVSSKYIKLDSNNKKEIKKTVQNNINIARRLFMYFNIVCKVCLINVDLYCLLKKIKKYLDV